MQFDLTIFVNMYVVKVLPLIDVQEKPQHVTSLLPQDIRGVMDVDVLNTVKRGWTILLKKRCCIFVKNALLEHSVSTKSVELVG